MAFSSTSGPHPQRILLTVCPSVPPSPQVSNGAVAMAKTTLEQLLVRCATPLKEEEKSEELLAAQDKSFHMVTHDLVREVTSPNSTVRKQAMHSLQVLAQVTGKSVTIIMEPHKEVSPGGWGLVEEGGEVAFFLFNHLSHPWASPQYISPLI